MDRVTFIIDGFNLYHSIREAAKDFKTKSTTQDVKSKSVKWLDINSLCSSYIYLFGKTAVLQEIYYFSALAKHLEARNANVTKRHQDFIQCLETTGVKTEINRFKKKTMTCPSCKCRFDKYEEKETDVAVAIKLLELLLRIAATPWCSLQATLI